MRLSGGQVLSSFTASEAMFTLGNEATLETIYTANTAHHLRLHYWRPRAQLALHGCQCRRDVQALAGHSSLAVTQRYIDGSEDARAKVVELV